MQPPHKCLLLLSLLVHLTLVAQSKLKPIALLEVYTSQGCSSCPSAENTLNSFFADTSFKSGEILLVSFHVDYWNENGWVDPFSKASYSERQRRYKAFLQSDGVYTPQFIINGTSGFSGANAPRLMRELKAAKQQAFPGNLIVDQLRFDANKLVFHYKSSDTTSAVLNAAIVHQSDTTLVLAGENAGRTMYSWNTVRSFINFKAKPTGGNAFFQLAMPFEKEKMKLLVWLQDPTTARVKDAIEVSLP